MKLKLSFIAILFSGYLSYSQKITSNLKVTCIIPYCGGARPTQEMQEKAQTPQAYGNKTIVAVNEKGKATKLKTNAEGLVKTKLKSGVYKLYESWRFNKNTPNGESPKNYDLKCLETEWAKEFAILDLSSKKADYKETNGIRLDCNFALPCMLDSSRPPLPQ